MSPLGPSIGPNFPGMYGPDPNLPALPPEFSMGGQGFPQMEPLQQGFPTLWPGMDPASGEIPGMPVVSPDERMSPGIPGTLEFSNLQRLGVEIQHAVANGEINELAVKEWAARPWMSYPFMAQRLSPSPLLDALGAWYGAAAAAGDPRMGDAFAQEWASQNPGP